MELQAAVNDVAGRIREAGPLGGAIGIVLPNGCAASVAVLACFAAGRVAILLNADHSPERNAAILQSAGIELAIVSTRGGAGAIPSGIPQLDIGDLRAGAAVGPADATPLPPGEAALVLYTSGSTGAPKGIALSQRTILKRVQNNIASLHLGPHDTFLSLGALGTTAGLVGSLAALLGGARQIIVSAAETGAAGLLTLIERERVTMVWGVPALLRLLFDDPRAAPALTGLRAIRTFGEPLLALDLERWRRVLPPTCHVATTYGQTEATIAQWFVPRAFAPDGPTLPAGYLLPEHEYAILDEHGRPAPSGEAGELVLRTRYAALGEWRDGRLVQASAERDAADPDRRILPTGDLVRLRPGALLQVVGRVDRQVKVRGHRVEPAEIEAALRAVPRVADAALLARPGPDGSVLVGFVVPAGETATAIVAEARGRLRTGLPSHMQPVRLFAIDRIPRLPGGKVDSGALAALDDGMAVAAADPGAARRIGEPASLRARRAVARAWLRTLGRGSLEADQTFVGAGGDSLALLKLVFRLEDMWGVALPLDLFHGEQRPTDLARMLDRLSHPAARLSDGRPAVFLFPGGGGRDELRLARFRRAAPGIRFHVVDFGAWQAWQGAGRDFDDIVSVLAEQIEARAPTGPLLLAGYSLGGHFADAVAALLAARRRSVPLVALLDTFRRIKTTRDMAPDERLAALEAKLRTAPAADRAFYRRHATQVASLFAVCRRKWQDRTEVASAVPMTLFRSSEHPASFPLHLGWERRYKAIRIVNVPGGHHTMLDHPNVDILGRAFADEVVRAVARRSPSAAPAV